jgi:hypothetical protein
MGTLLLPQEPNRATIFNILIGQEYYNIDSHSQENEAYKLKSGIEDIEEQANVKRP